MLKRLFASRKHPYVPGLNQREKIEIDISGSRLSILLPPHSDSEGFRREPPPRQINLHDPEKFYTDEESPEWQRSGNAHYLGKLADRHWEFYGPPWRPRPYGFIAFSMGITRQDALPEGMSCFNPEHFEQIIDRTLYFASGGPAQPEFAKEKAPVNWRPHLESGTNGFYFERHPDIEGKSCEPESVVFANRSCSLLLPLEHRYSLGIAFRYFGYTPTQNSLANMNSVRNSVLSSIRLELGATAKAQLAEAQQKWPEARVSEHREPNVWDYPKWRVGDSSKGEPSVVISELGTPPPEFTP